MDGYGSCNPIIMDNLFFFWEAIALAHKKKEDLAILLLDFEKAYQVDWDFLHGIAVRLGFPKKWVIGMSSLYKSAYNSISLGGVKDYVFQISRILW